MNNYVGRTSAVGQLTAFLDASQPRKGLSILSVEGPGGIGKTALLDHVLGSRSGIEGNRYLVLRISGRPDAASDPYTAVRELLNSATTPGEAAAQRPALVAARFTQTLAVLAAYDDLLAQVRRELQKRTNMDDDLVESSIRIIRRATALGRPLNDLLPKSREWVDFHKLERRLPAVETALRELRSLQDESIGWLDRLGFGPSARRNTLRHDPLRVLADAFRSDVHDLIAGYPKREVLRPAQRKIVGLERLLVILDDYECLSEGLSEFLTGHLLTALRSESLLDVRLIVLGRDALKQTHPGWDQHLARQMEPPIRLSTLSKSELGQLLVSHGVGQGPLNDAWEQTEGYPLLVQLWLEERDEHGERSGPSIGMLKRFYDRTTRWMTDEQKRWLEYALFLEAVNIESLGALLRDAEEAARAMAWFEADGSVRDPNGDVYRVKRYVRLRLVEYLRRRDPARHKQLTGAANALNVEALR